MHRKSLPGKGLKRIENAYRPRVLVVSSEGTSTTVQAFSEQMNRSLAVKNFLLKNAQPDLANLYHYCMEMQANVAQDGGTKVDGKFQGRQWVAWTDGIQTWKSFRIPYNAMTNPTHDDKPLTYDFERHIEGIGMTGWDWLNKRSRWCAYDFDAMVGHSDRHSRKCSEDELKEIKDRLLEIPWVTLRYSTSGQGLHVYVHIADTEVIVENHTQHAAIARSILSKLSGLTGFDFHSKVDICGGNMWVWHRKQMGTNGLTLIKQGGKLEEIPINWADHLTVVSGHRKKNKPFFINSNQELDPFEELTGKRAFVKLDGEHKKLMLWIEENYPNTSWWDNDYHMLVTHTSILKEAHTRLSMRGIFKTNTTGSSARNCYAFPIRHGAWVVRRYSIGVKEDISWEHNDNDYTKCYLNREPDLATLARAYGAIEDTDGGFYFLSGEVAIEAAKMLGVTIDIPNWAMHRKCKLKNHKDGRLLIELEAMTNDHSHMKAGDLEGWNLKSKAWKRIFNIKTSQNSDPQDLVDYDDLIRHLVTESGQDAGWTIKAADQWTSEPLVHIVKALKSLGEKATDPIVGNAIMKRWVLVNRPFEPEFPGDRIWNRNAPQLAFVPTNDKDNLSFPSWQKVLTHVGKNLDHALLDNGWARTNGITTGSEYLKCWIASLFQQPFEQLPYLFLYGPEDCGKTIFWEGLTLLLTQGFCKGDYALTNQSGFNGELQHSILCVVEEVDISKSKVAHARMKDWITAKHINIRPMYCQPYLVPNLTHWVQTANSHNFCPIFEGDSRITMIDVSPFDIGEMIPKNEFLTLLKKEAPDFLAEILAFDIPKTSSRLAIPIVETARKIAVQRTNKTELELFLEEHTFYYPGKLIKFSEFCERFYEWLDPNYRQFWTKITIGRKLPIEYPHARLAADGAFYIANISWEAPNGEAPKPPYIVRKDPAKKYEYLVPNE